MARVFLAITFFLIATVVSADDPYVSARETVSASSTDIYYPSCLGSDGVCTGPIPAGQRFSGTIFLQGGSVDAAFYTTIASKLASAGFIVAVPNAPIQIIFGTQVQLTSPQIALAAKNLLIARDIDSSSAIYGRLVPNSFALSGHSFGGVMAILAASHDAPFLCGPTGPLRTLCNGYAGFGAGLKGVVTYGTSMVDRGRLGVVTLFNTNTAGIPVVLIRGKNDGRLLLVDAQRTYDEALETPKAFIELDFANHFGITDAQTCPGCTSDINPQPKSQDWSTDQIRKIMVVALRAHLNGEANALNKIYVEENLGPNFITVTAAQLS